MWVRNIRWAEAQRRAYTKPASVRTIERRSETSHRAYRRIYVKGDASQSSWREKEMWVRNIRWAEAQRRAERPEKEIIE